jgi:hypothetical protein
MKFSEWNESPILVVLDPSKMGSDIPILVYESNIELSTGELTISKTGYRIDTTDAERIGISHAVHSSNAGDAKEVKCTFI